MRDKIFIDGDFNNEKSYSRIYKKEHEEKIKALKVAQKRLTWIDNVKRIQGLTQEQAEAKWTEIFNLKP